VKAWVEQKGIVPAHDVGDNVPAVRIERIVYETAHYLVLDSEGAERMIAFEDAD